MSNKPFDLEKALAGEPVMLLNNNPPLKVYLSRSKLRDDGIIFEFEDKDRTVCRHSEKWLEGFGTNIVMWEEPRPRITLTLPCPLKEPQEGMWHINRIGQVLKSNYIEGDSDSFVDYLLQNGFYFATKEDAQEWLEAMRNARR